MSLLLLCDEHIAYPITEALRRRGLNVLTVQDAELSASKDLQILEFAQKQNRVIYTQDTDFLRLHATGISHNGILYHHALAYSLKEAIRKVALACEVYNTEEMKNHIEFL